MEIRCTFSVHYTLFCLLFCLCHTPGRAQSIGPATFDRLPQDYQLYPRNEQNEAQIPISGRINEAGWGYVSALVFRNKQAIGYQRASINYDGGNGRFVVNPITIRAERAEYDISLYAVRGSDSVKIVERTNIVAGDVYVLTGQSNASAFFRDTRTNEFCRTFGKISGTYGTEIYNPADTLWTLSNASATAENVGTMGFEFQRLILEKYGIPTCLINGAFHWSMAAHHANRTPENPADLTNGYGRLIYRLKKGGLDRAVKALIYRQGESEAYGEGMDWGGNFDRYYQNLKRDLPSIRQHYVFQIDIIESGVAAAPVVRESQRVLSAKYPDVQVVASIGTDGFDGLHYSEEGYKQNALEFTRLIGRDFYGDSDVSNIDAPNIRRAYFSNDARTELTLQFADGQDMVWPDAFDGRSITDFLYLDGRPGDVTAGRTDGNRVILSLKTTTNATKLTYLPGLSPGFIYRGPYLTNRRGLRALSFLDVPIADPVDAPKPTLSAPTLTVSPVSLSSLQLTWNVIANATAYVLEVRDRASGTFRPVSRVAGDMTAYTVTGLADNTGYTFRIKAVNGTTESAYSQAEGRTPTVPAAPAVQAVATFANAVSLSWQPVTEAIGYVIERRTATETAFTPVAKLDPGTFIFVDKSLIDSSLYVYRIKTVGRFGDSPFATAEVRTPAFLATPKLTVTVDYNNAFTVNWSVVANATSYRLTRKTADQDIRELGTFAPGAVSVRDTNLTPGTSYTYQIQAFGDRTESPVVTGTVTLPTLLTTPEITLTVLYNNALRINWKAIPGAARYQVERKTAAQPYQRVGTFDAATVAVRDTNLTPGASYTYRIQAFGDKTESVTATAAVQLPGLLPKPAIDLDVLYNNALTVSWQAVPNATAYQVERKAPGQEFQAVGTFGAVVVAAKDTNLVPGTTYVYRIRALGDVTESPFVTDTATTPRLLDTPQLVAESSSFNVMRLSWQPVAGVLYYVLDRRKQDAGTYQQSVKLTGTTVNYADSSLIDNTLYAYRLTAYGDKTRSEAVIVTATTLPILSVVREPVVTMQLWPNPAREQTSLRFSEPTSGTLQVIDVRGRVCQQQPLTNVTELPLSVGTYPAGLYLIRVTRATDVLTTKLVVE